MENHCIETRLVLAEGWFTLETLSFCFKECSRAKQRLRTVGVQVRQITRTQVGRWRLYEKKAVVCDVPETLEEERNY